MMLMIPEAWAGNPLMDAKRRAFYEYHAALMEPWDGPAAVAFTDGKFIGATLDRNGLRPARYFITDDDLIVMSSEMGVLDIRRTRSYASGACSRGKMLLVDIEHGRIVSGRGAEARPRRAAPVPGLARPHADPPRGHRPAVGDPDPDTGQAARSPAGPSATRRKT
jgi:glutamate synthase (NADPH/NADH) large chain